jgi:uncharacterized protein YbjT (DUF2867 family)
LLASPASTVHVWTRRTYEKQHPKLKAKTVDFDQLQELRVEADDVYCCLGTTIKQAGSREAFRRVDYDYVLALAKAAARDGAKRLLVVSSLGADPRSRVFYSRVKGEMEEAVGAAGVATTIFFRPALLSGPRAKYRLGERIGLVVGSVLGPLLGRYRPIHGDLVAAAMVRAAERGLPSQVFESEKIRALAQSRSS